MKAAIFASTAPLGAALRHVLGAFHGQKRQAGVEAMLARLYEPILFRAFGASNPDVRRNALLLLLDAFPVRVRVGGWGLHAVSRVREDRGPGAHPHALITSGAPAGTQAGAAGVFLEQHLPSWSSAMTAPGTVART